MGSGSMEQLCMRNLLQSYKIRMNINNNVGLNVILYCHNFMYEYNPFTHEIRPFNSLIWYKLDTDKYPDLIEYIEKEYSNIDTDKAYSGENVGIGSIINNTLVISLDQLRDIIFNSEEINKVTKYNLVSQLNALIFRIKVLYEEWRKVATFILEEYSEVENILNIRRTI